MSDINQFRTIEESMEEPDEGVVDEGVEEAAPADDRPEWLDPKFKSVEDQARSYHELQKKLGERQPPPEPEPVEEEYDPALYAPQMPMPLGGAPRTEEELNAWTAQDPRSASMWVLTNQDALPRNIVEQTVETWAALDPVGWTQFSLEAQRAEMQQAYDERIAQLEQRFAPHDQAHQAQVAQTTVQMIQQAIPEWDAYKEQVTALLQQHPAFSSAWKAATTPAEWTKLSQDAYALVKWNEMQAQQAAEQTPQNQPAPPRARTATRQGASNGRAGQFDEGDDIIKQANASLGIG